MPGGRAHPTAPLDGQGWAGSGAPGTSRCDTSVVAGGGHGAGVPTGSPHSRPRTTPRSRSPRPTELGRGRGADPRLTHACATASRSPSLGRHRRYVDVADNHYTIQRVMWSIRVWVRPPQAGRLEGARTTGPTTVNAQRRWKCRVSPDAVRSDAALRSAHEDGREQSAAAKLPCRVLLAGDRAR